MLSLQVLEKLLKYQKIKINDIEIMNVEFGSSSSLGYIRRSKWIAHNTY